MSNRTIEAALKLSTKLGDMKAFSVISRELKKVDQQSKAMSRSQIAMAKSSSAAYATMARYVAPAAAVLGAKQAYVAFAQNERQLDRIGLNLGATKEQMRILQTDLQGVANKYALTNDQLTQTVDAYAQAGAELGDIRADLDGLGKAQQALDASGSDIVNTWDTARKSLGLATKDAEKFFEYIGAGSAAGKFEARDMAQHMPSLLPSAAKQGMTGLRGGRDMVAFLEVMRDYRGTSGEAATAVGDFLEKLSDPGVQRNLDKINSAFVKQIDETRRAGGDMLKTVHDILQQATGGDASKLGSIFGDKEARAAATVILTKFDQIREAQNKIDANAPGLLDRNVERVLDGALAKIDRLGGSWDKLKTSFGSGLHDAGLTDILGATADRIDYGAAVDRGLDATGIKGTWNHIKWGLFSTQAQKDEKAWIGNYRTAEQRQMIDTYGQYSKLRQEPTQREGTFGFGRDDNGAPIPIATKSDIDFENEWIRQKVDGAITAIAQAATAKQANAPYERAEAARRNEIAMLSDGGATYEKRIASGYYRNQAMGGDAVAGPVNSIAQAIAQLETRGQGAGDAIQAGGDAAGRALADAGQTAASQIAAASASLVAAGDSFAAKVANLKVSVNVQQSGQAAGRSQVNVNPGRSMVNAGRVGGPD